MRYMLLALVFQPLVASDMVGDVTWEGLLGRAEELNEQGRYAEAQQIAERTLHAAERFGPDDNRIAVALNLMGLVHNYLGRHSQAKHDYMRGIKMLEKCACEPLLLSRLLHNLATLYMDLGAPEAQSERLCRRALELGVSELAPDNPDIGRLLSNLAASLMAQRRFSEASALYERALTIFKVTPGALAPEIASILTNRAVLAFRQGRLPDAVSDLKGAVGIFEEALGSGHPSLVRPLLNLARIYLVLDRATMAEEPLQRAAAIAETALGSEHPTLGEVLTTYGAALRKTGRKKEARGMEARANAIRLAYPTHTANLTVHIDDLLSQSPGKASR